jgi:hypothetical protein
LILLAALVTVNGSIITLVLLPLLAFTLWKIVQNRSLSDGVQSVINMIVRSVGLLKGCLHPVRDPLTPPNSKIIQQ